MTRLTKTFALVLCIVALFPAQEQAQTQAQEQALADTERGHIAKVIDDSIGWFKTKDFDLLFDTFADDPELFMFQPGSTGTVHGIEAFRALSAIWRDPDTKYLSHEVRDLRIHLSQSGDVAWFSAILDDCGEYKGQAGCWIDARWTGVLEKRESRWVIVQAHFSFAADKMKEESEKDDGKIAFTAAREGNYDVFVMNEDGSNPLRLTDHPETDGYAAWSPDGTRIAFYAYHGSTTWAIHVMNADGSDRQRLTYSQGSWHSAPAWSPDGERIAFGVDKGDLHELWIMNADGSGQRQLGNARGGGPDWSPGGARIAFHCWEEGDPEICVADSAGENIQPLTDNDAEDWHPDWSPDGAKIAFMSDRDGDYEIYSMNADGTNLIQLTDNDAEDWEPDWSADGLRLLFYSMRDGNYEIYIMNADGSDQARITHNATHDIQPAWRP